MPTLSVGTYSLPRDRFIGTGTGHGLLCGDMPLYHVALGVALPKFTVNFYDKKIKGRLKGARIITTMTQDTYQSL